MMIAIIWVVLSGIGMLFAIADAAEAVYRFLLLSSVDMEDSRVRGLAFTTTVSQTARALLLVIFFVIGINALTANSSTLFVGLMFAANIVVVAAAVQSHRFRRRLFARQEEPAEQSD